MRTVRLGLVITHFNRQRQVLGAVARFNGFSILKLIRYLKAELLLVLGQAPHGSSRHALLQ